MYVSDVKGFQVDRRFWRKNGVFVGVGIDLEAPW